VASHITIAKYDSERRASTTGKYDEDNRERGGALGSRATDEGANDLNRDGMEAHTQKDEEEEGRHEDGEARRGGAT